MNQKRHDIYKPGKKIVILKIWTNINYEIVSVKKNCLYSLMYLTHLKGLFVMKGIVRKLYECKRLHFSQQSKSNWIVHFWYEWLNNTFKVLINVFCVKWTVLDWRKISFSVKRSDSKKLCRLYFKNSKISN